MGAWGASIMAFFGAVFAGLAAGWQRYPSPLALAWPVAVFGVIAAAAIVAIRRPGIGIVPSAREARAIMWSSIGEGVGLFVVGNLVMNLHRPELLLPAMALVVGLHFLPIGWAGGFRPFLWLGAGLIGAAVAGVWLGGAVAGNAAAAALWLAAVLAVDRDRKAKARIG